MPGTSATETDTETETDQSKPAIRIEEWDHLPDGRRVAVVEADGETIIIARRGEAAPEFLRELEGVFVDEIRQVWSRDWPTDGHGVHQAA